MIILHLFLSIAFLALACVNSTAQLQVELKMSRTLYMIYEPTLAQVSITNLSGRDLNLEDTPGHPWFSFEIFSGTSLIPPNNPDYHIEPLYLPAGKTVKRTLNLSPLYSLQNYGPHAIKAVIYVSGQDHYYPSNRKVIEITDGRMIWNQTVGAPVEAGGGTRNWALLSHRLSDRNQLYVRLMDPENNRVVACFAIGTLLSFSPPEHQFDSQNQLHVLQLTGPNTYLYSFISLNGQVISREGYLRGKISLPRLVKDPSGAVRVKGGKLDVPETPEEKNDQPKLSDRPIPLPS